jgi:glycosyltransferase involved in cell wall biosynthesis
LKIILIIPAYNEEESILNTIASIETFKKSDPQLLKKNVLDYIVINDGSVDKTQQLLDEKQVPSIRLIQNLGIGGAVQTGYKYAFEKGYDIAVQFDGDGQHDINSLSEVVRPIIENEADFCIGSRFIDTKASEFQTTSMRRMGIKIISALIKIVTGKRIYDVTSGYRAVKKDIIKMFCDRYPVEYPEPETIVHMLKKKVRLKECAVNMKERNGGRSSIHSFKSMKYMIEVCGAIIIAGFMKEGD